MPSWSMRTETSRTKVDLQDVQRQFLPAQLSGALRGVLHEGQVMRMSMMRTPVVGPPAPTARSASPGKRAQRARPGCLTALIVHLRQGRGKGKVVLLLGYAAAVLRGRPPDPNGPPLDVCPGGARLLALLGRLERALADAERVWDGLEPGKEKRRPAWTRPPPPGSRDRSRGVRRRATPWTPSLRRPPSPGVPFRRSASDR